MGKLLGISQLYTSKQEAMRGCQWGMAEATLEGVLELERVEELTAPTRGLRLHPELSLEAARGPERKVRVDKVDEEGCTSSLSPPSPMLVFLLRFYYCQVVGGD